MEESITKIKHPDGFIEYIKDDYWHNTKGPATIRKNGTKEWFINGIWIFTIFYDKSCSFNQIQYKKFKNFIFQQIYLLNKKTI